MKFKKKQERWLQLKRQFLLGNNMQNCDLVGEIKTFGAGGVF